MKILKYAIFAGIVVLVAACKSPVTVTHEVCEGLFIVTQSDTNEFKQQHCMK
ncbi:hypothetical protein [Providencia heimbachae]|uniref:hypothetical protein n=1 Tax=Providencia heimbachae TaxID=333962 RepID=UPI001586BFE9|nr:hypothetical protein [Providencia heimbachae]